MARDPAAAGNRRHPTGAGQAGIFSTLSCLDYQGLTGIGYQKVTMQKKKPDF
ncbi:MAG: hypothetical protein ISS81_05185 [Candidatus Marinimicrobia bacterium]|nr:hypothetical protein [Candidatus Neomarinimicrobiota bacterium]